MNVPARILILSVVLAFTNLPNTKAQRATLPSSQIPTVSLCDLARDHDFYDQKVVRITAISVEYYHGTYLYDPACTAGDASMNLEIEDPDTYKPSAKVIKEVERAQATSRYPKSEMSRARVVMVGRFRDWDGVGYGNLSAFRFEFAVQKFEHAEPVASQVPWGTDSDESGSFMKTVEELRQMSNDWNAALLGSYLPTIERVLPDDYTLVDEQGRMMSRQEVIAWAAENRKNINDKSRMEMRTTGRVFINGETATVVGCADSTRGDKLERLYGYTDQYVKRSDKWVLISSRLNTMEPDPESHNLPCVK